MWKQEGEYRDANLRKAEWELRCPKSTKLFKTRRKKNFCAIARNWLEANSSYVGRVLRLTLLSPEIVEAILDGRQPADLQLEDLLRPFPVGWREQRAEIWGPYP
jgi:hypothetical protein